MHQLIGSDDEVRQDRSLLRATQRQGGRSGDHLERTEDPELQPTPRWRRRRRDRDERLHGGRDVRLVGGHGHDVDRLRQPFDVDQAAVYVADATHRAREVDDLLAGQDLARGGLAAQARSEIDGAAAVALVDRHGLTGVEADPDRERHLGRCPCLLEQASLEVDGRPDGLPRRVEGDQRLVTAHLDQAAARGLDLLAHDGCEAGRQGCRRFVASAGREARVAADVGDQEALDSDGRCHAISIRPRGAIACRVGVAGSPLVLPHAAEYRPLRD